MTNGHKGNVDYQTREEEEARGFVRVIASKHVDYYKSEIQEYKDHFEITILLPDWEPSFNRYGRDGMIKTLKEAIVVMDGAMEEAVYYILEELSNQPT